MGDSGSGATVAGGLPTIVRPTLKNDRTLDFF